MMIFRLTVILGITSTVLAIDQQQNYYNRVGILSHNVASRVYKIQAAQSKVECGALCSAESMGQCNSFIYSKKQNSCSLSKLELNSWNASSPNPDVHSFVRQGESSSFDSFQFV